MRITRVLSLLLIVTIACFLAGCGSSSQPATVNLSLSDPATCASPQGPYRHVYVTITDVQINRSANASDNDPGWIDLTPNLKSNPVQTDLLGVANQCFLATLGSSGLQPGTYQQMRVILADNSVSIPGNKCGNFANCLMLTSDPTNTPVDINMSSETTTGIKIPSGQIAGGQFTVAAGDNKDLNIDFNACASVVVQGNNQYRMKPVLHAGEVAMQSTDTSVSGTVLDGSTQQPVVGGNTVVALEQNQNGVDRVVMETVTNSGGTFSFCPVPAGNYDVVIASINGSGIIYAPTVITGVGPGNALGNILMTAAGAPALMNGTATSAGSTGPVAVDLSLSALLNAGSFQVTVPLAAQSSSTATTSTISDVSCPVSTDCVSYSLSVPAANPSIGAYLAGTAQSPAAPASGTVNYTVEGQAFVPGAAGLSDCSPSTVQASVSVTAGANVSVNPFGFIGCQ